MTENARGDSNAADRALDGASRVQVALEPTDAAQWIEWLGNAFVTSPLAMVITDNDRIVHANAALARFLGRATTEDLVGERLDQHRIDDVPATGRRLVDDGGEQRFRHLSGSVAWGRVTRTVCTTPDERVLAFIQLEDVTQARLVRAELDATAAHDTLTGLVDRRSLIEAITDAIGATPRTALSLIVVDVDRIGSINASLGQPEGDRLLEVVAGRLHFATRQDDVVSRLGGDQFAVLLRGPARDDESEVTAERLLELLREPISLGGQSVTGSVSIGVSSAHHTSTVESLLSEADVALRHAKSAGRNRVVVFDDDFRSAVASRSRLEGELRVALSGARLELFFQPEVDLVTGDILGVEALARWPHPTLGLLSADAFVRVAEDVGLAAELGRWALDTACDHLSAWTPRWPNLSMRVNVSAPQLGRRSLIAEVARTIERTGIDPARLCLEITETAVMTDVEESMRVLAALHDLGVELAIDDFGTGFSSLAYLRRFPVEILKIDQSFVADVADRDGRAIVAAVLQLAASLDLDVIAEGIETDLQHRDLVALGCTRGQGHLFSAALPAPDFLTWLESR